MANKLDPYSTAYDGQQPISLNPATSNGGIQMAIPLPTGMTVNGDGLKGPLPGSLPLDPYGRALPHSPMPGAPIAQGRPTYKDPMTGALGLLPTLSPNPGTMRTPLPSLDGVTAAPGVKPGSWGAPAAPVVPGQPAGAEQTKAAFLNSLIPQSPAGTPGANPANFGPAQTVQDMLNSFINGEYADNAYRRGVEQAGGRGLMNSSIAGGQGQRAALEAVQPFVSEGMNLLGAREQRAFQGQEAQLDRIQGVNNMILGSNIQERQMQIANALEQGNMTLAQQLQRQQARQDFEFRRLLQGDSVAQQDWLSSNAFSREFNSNLSMLPVTSSMDMMRYLMQLGSEDPEVYTPGVLSGMQNFFQQSLMGILAQFFPNSMQPANNTPAAPISTTPARGLP